MSESVEIRAVYGFLRPFRHDSRRVPTISASARPLVLKLVHSWKAAGAGLPAPGDQAAITQSVLDLDTESEEQSLDYDDPLAILARERKAEKQKVQDREVASERRQEQRHVSEETEQEAEERRLHDWHSSEQYRHAIAEFSGDIEDARQAVSLARARAAVEQQRAREALENAQRGALVVNGSRVYFAQDGSRLYGEDERQITDFRTFTEAQRQRLTKPEATTYEDYAARTKANHVAADKVRKLDEAAVRLDELDRRIKKGDLSPEDLVRARQDKQDVIDALPAEARAEYERLHKARIDDRKLAYKAADPAFTSAPDLNGSFQQAVSATVSPPDPASQAPGERRNPIYKAAPDY